jgi:poly-gamma-glutamate capsule biosynthesis protein CapA/YwtB (metallophosphatase superfamily)
MKVKLFIAIPLIIVFLSLFGLMQYYNTGNSDSRSTTSALPVTEEDVIAEPADSKIAGESYNSNGSGNTPGTSTPDDVFLPPVAEEQLLTIAAVGDIMLGRGVGSRLEKGNFDYKYPFEEVVDFLREGDIVFGNLEQPMTNSEKCLDKRYKYVLKSKPKAVESLKYAGFNLLNLANNHILDYYDRGLFDTLDILDSNGIMHAGAGKNINEAREPAVIEKNGIKTALISYTDMSEYFYAGNPSINFAAEENKAGVAPRKLESILEDIDKIRKSVDILMVSLHWGVEESFHVQPEQVEFAHQLIDKGADVILGHHPHQFQGIEIYRGKPIFYSLGNFIFDQNDPENQESFIVIMKYKNNELSSLTAIPVKTKAKTQVVRQTGDEALGILNREIELSLKHNIKCHIEDDKLVFELP